ncbi:MAG TPA: heavy metal translocating P-type ATPase [Azospira sp.]|nr:heavy metal translocating P-type ATPase [Azospira sp.]
MSQGPCYHCGQSIPPEVDLTVRVNNSSHAMCCIGCQAVAQAIVDNGLADYYRNRDALPESPREALPEVLENLRLFDHADFQKSFVRDLGEHEREASLILEGITCAACIWLNEQHISQVAGVSGVDINYTTRRARVRWDASRVQLSDILAAISAIGYRAYPYDPARTEELAKKERRDALWRVWVAGFGMMQVMMYAIPVYMAEGDMSADIESLMRWASLLLTLPVVFYSAAPFFRNAWRDLKFRRVGMDVPVALGVGAAFLASIWATVAAAGEVYFDSVTMFVFFLLGGRFLEMNARQRAVGVTEALAKLLPAFAEKLPGYPAQRSPDKVVVADLVPGDVVMVRAGGVIPSDGRVLEGSSSVNEALLTGESLPITKAVGDVVTGGAINVESPLVIKVEQVGEGTRLSAIVRLMERAAMEKPRIVEFADRIASRFVAALLAVAALVALVWWQVDADKALWITVSVLVVTCPCALSLATPIALTVASGALAREGLLVTRGHAIETLARATHFVFDKTGTLTTGRMRLLEVQPLCGEEAESVLRLACALEEISEHPVGQAFRSAAEGLAPWGEPIESVANVPGSGIAARSATREYRIGRPDFVADLVGQPLPPETSGFLSRGDTIVAVGSPSGWIALFALGDEIRSEARALISHLTGDGRQVVLLSGDTPAAAQRIADVLGIQQVHGGVSPQGKHDFVSRLQEDGAIVAMVGDGVNDAPVLAQAQVSVAMGGGAQLARTQADFVLLSENLDHLRRGVALSGKALTIIRQNLIWSFAYNFVALPLAMLGFVTPWMAGIGMSGSSLLVVLKSLRLQRPL